MIQLYNYFRSSASYRVRIALELKGLPYEYIAVHLTKDGGEQFKPEYKRLNPDALVPTYLDDEGHRLTQSLAIIEYLEEIYPTPALLPKSPAERAYVRALALQIACEIHPIDNLRVLNYLTDTLKVETETRSAWYRHWIELGFASLEEKLIEGGLADAFVTATLPHLPTSVLCPRSLTQNV